MNIQVKRADHTDRTFLNRMLYEAIFWRKSENTPSYEESQKLDFVQTAQEDWGDRPGDTAIIAFDGTEPIGAVWYRYWQEEHKTRGCISSTIPVLAIGIDKQYRNKGIGQLLIERLMEVAKEQHIGCISLCVSKDNYAKRLYDRTGFELHEDIGDSYIMVRHLKV